MGMLLVVAVETPAGVAVEPVGGAGLAVLGLLAHVATIEPFVPFVLANGGECLDKGVCVDRSGEADIG